MSKLLQRHQLHDYQTATVNEILDFFFYALFLDMGLGKTVTALTAIVDLLRVGDITNVLVTAPKRVAETTWPDEITNWRHTQHLKISRIVGTAKQRRHALKVKADVYLIGRENIPWLIGQYGGSMLPFDMLVIDESSSFKNHKSQRFKALKGVLASFRRILLLTGTPAPNGLIDLWSQIFILDRGERLGRFIGNYRREYFNEGKKNGNIVYSYKIKRDGEARIHHAISDICMSMKAADYLDLPGRVDNIITLTMPSKLAEQYETFEREQVLEFLEYQEKLKQDRIRDLPVDLDDNEDGWDADLDDWEDGEPPQVYAVNAAALTNKLLQFANGAVYDTEKDWHAVHDLKLDAALEVIEAANGKPVLIGWTYRSDRERLMKKLKAYNPVNLKTEQHIRDWNNGNILVMMMHPASGGHGLNLQKGGHHILWFGNPWSSELYQQFNARLDRQGQTEVVSINRLVVAGTMDEEVVAALNRKTATQNELMAAVKFRIDKYRK